MSEPFLAEIRIFSFSFAPSGWADCSGQVLSIRQYTALFSLLGTTYGGNGQTTFALPNLIGNAPMHPGQGPGLSQHVLGEMSGSATATLLITEIPSHTHQVRAVTADPGENFAPSPTESIARSSGGTVYHAPGGAPALLAPQALTAAGSSQPHNNLQPYLTLRFCIALQGIYPSRP